TNPDGSNGTPQWTQLTVPGPLPPARWVQHAAYDRANNRMVVYGGRLGGDAGAALTDVWVLTNANGLTGTPSWIQLTPSGTAPVAREHLFSTYAEASNRFLIFGGVNDATKLKLNDTWVLTNASGVGGTPSWVQLTPTSPPSPRDEGV